VGWWQPEADIAEARADDLVVFSLRARTSKRTCGVRVSEARSMEDVRQRGLVGETLGCGRDDFTDRLRHVSPRGHVRFVECTAGRTAHRRRRSISVGRSQGVRLARPPRYIDFACSTQAVQHEIEHIEIAELPAEGDVGVLIA
jgi:hypothetical protein